MSSSDTDLEDVMDRLDDAGERDRVTINDVLATFEDQSSGVLVTVLGLLAALPVIGAVPGLSMVVSLLILGVMVHGLVGGPLRLPGAPGRLGADRDKFKRAIEGARKYTRYVDRLLDRRLTLLTEGKVQRALIFLMIGVLAVAMFPLELVPWGVTFPAFGIVALGLALMVGDGVFALFGYAMALATVWLVTSIV